MGVHEQSVGATDEWYTPPHIFEALGCEFDMDVASPGADITPWIPAKIFLTKSANDFPWSGFIWMNPPFGGRNAIAVWLQKFFQHKNGIALVPDRTSAPWWQWFAPCADVVLFVSPKIKFLDSSGKPGRSPAQGTCLLAIGQQANDAVHKANVAGLGAIMTPLDM